MNLVRLSIKNFLSIADVEIKPGQITQIVGRNNQGKTTIIKALEFAMKGSTDGSMVKFNEDHAEVVVELDDVKIKRLLFPNGTQAVDVRKGPEGLRPPAPQAFLEKLMDATAFNPLEVLDPKKRSDAIMAALDIEVTPDGLAEELGIKAEELPPVDWKQHGLKVLEQVHKYFYQRRAEANRETAAKEQRWKTYQKDLPEAVPQPKFTRHELAVEKLRLKEKRDKVAIEAEQCKRENAARSATQAKLNRAHELIAEHTRKLNAIELEAKSLEDKIDDIRIQCREFEKDLSIPVVDPSTWVEKLGKVEIEIAELSTHEKDIERVEAVEKQHKMVTSLQGEAIAAAEVATSIDLRVKALAGPIKAKYMAHADMPIKGLEYRDGQFMVNGVAVDNLSSSHTMRLAIGVARKLSKRSKVICIDGAEALDEQTFAEMRKEIEDDGYTYLLTKVGGPFVGNDTIVPMQDGKVVQ